MTKGFLALAPLLVVSSTLSATSANVLFVLDGSGSMWGQIGGQPKIEIARSAMSGMIEKLPTDVRAGLMTYGGNTEGDCNDIEMVAPMGSDHASLVLALNDINPMGKTPLAASIRQATTYFQQTESDASVVLVSDGKETCDGDPCIAAGEANNAGVGLNIHVVGFDVTGDEKKQLTCIAEQGKGKYFPANNTDELVMALAEVEKEVAEPADPEPAPEATDDMNLEDHEDHFDRDELGEMYELVNRDPDRFAVSDGKAFSVPTNPPANLVLLKSPLSDDFVATINVTTQVTLKNRSGLYYWVDDENYVFVAISTFGTSRAAYFGKSVGGKRNETYSTDPVGSRKMKGESPEPEIWYLQLAKKGPKFAGRISIDGKKWGELGTQALLKKDGRLGFRAGSGGGIESPAEFDDFIVRQVE